MSILRGDKIFVARVQGLLAVVLLLLMSCLFGMAAQAAPAYGNTYYRTTAQNAIADLATHFWVGSNTTGHVLNTFGGYAVTTQDPRGYMWERAMFSMAMESLWEINADPVLSQRVTADWNYVKSVFSANELAAIGPGTQAYGQDDAAWGALYYLSAYKVTQDPYALDRAKAIALNAYNRWYSDSLGGGMWYNDATPNKSLYQAGSAVGFLKIADLTGDKDWRRRAMLCYVWMEKFLLRPDGLYWCDANASGPIGIERPGDIHEAGSVTFLGGNMAMALLHARLYKSTGQDIYRARAVRTANAIMTRIVSKSGVLMDDRDAWANGTFACDYAREVLSLPGIDTRQVQMVCATAYSIYTLGRTSDGYYSGCWSGTADGSGCAWWLINSKAEQIMTSSSSVDMVIAAAALAQGSM